MSQRSRYSFDLFLPAVTCKVEQLAEQAGAGVGGVGWPGSVNYWDVNWSNIVPFNDLGPNAKFNCKITATGYQVPEGRLLDMQANMYDCFAVGLTMSGLDTTIKPQFSFFQQSLIAPLSMVGEQRQYLDNTSGEEVLQQLQYYTPSFNIVVRNPSQLTQTKLYLTPLCKEILNNVYFIIADREQYWLDGLGGQTISYQLEFDLISTD